MEKKRVRTGKWLMLLLLSVFVLTVFDQWTKQLAVQYLRNQEAIVLLPGIFELRYLENRGAAFGILKDRRIVFLVLTCLIMAVILYVYIKIPEKKHYLPLRILCIGILSGAVGNMIDRCLNGYVVDFLYFSLIDFPIFNVADIYVTVSACLWLLLSIFFYRDEDYTFLLPKKKEKESV